MMNSTGATIKKSVVELYQAALRGKGDGGGGGRARQANVQCIQPPGLLCRARTHPPAAAPTRSVCTRSSCWSGEQPALHGKRQCTHAARCSRQNGDSISYGARTGGLPVGKHAPRQPPCTRAARHAPGGNWVRTGRCQRQSCTARGRPSRPRCALRPRCELGSRAAAYSEHRAPPPPP